MKPLIGVTGCFDAKAELPLWYAKLPYIDAALNAVGGAPVILPGGGDAEVIERWLDGIDGLLVTGSPSNVEPVHYSGPASAPGTAHDPARDAYSLPLIRRAIERGIPLLAICRGHQELNVALGGSLHQKLQDVPGHFDHRPDPDKPVAQRFADAHTVQHRKGGFMASLTGCMESTVNSYHEQAVERLAPRLQVESEAEDGTVEAVTVKDAPGFTLGVQWHPEWSHLSNDTSRAIFAAFTKACNERLAARTRKEPELA
jgi:putative glutamine amidotransferase